MQKLPYIWRSELLYLTFHQASKMETIQLPLSQYQQLQEELALLKNSDLMKKMDKLIDLLYQEKYGLYMGNFTDDLSQGTMNQVWNDKPSVWDHV